MALESFEEYYKVYRPKEYLFEWRKAEHIWQSEVRKIYSMQ
jgi:hypothetical protein